MPISFKEAQMFQEQEMRSRIQSIFLSSLAEVEENLKFKSFYRSSGYETKTEALLLFKKLNEVYGEDLGWEIFVLKIGGDSYSNTTYHVYIQEKGRRKREIVFNTFMVLLVASVLLGATLFVSLNSHP